MKIPVNQLPKHLQTNLHPVYLVTGDETLLVQEALDRIRQAARDAGFGSRDRYVATTGFDWSQLAQASGNLSLFAERRIVDLELPTGKPGRIGGAAIIDFVERLDDSLMLIVSAPKLDKATTQTKWVKALDAAGAVIQVWPVGVRELPGWIDGRMRAAGLTPARSVVELLADRVEGNLLAADQEIEKLRLLCGEGPVSVEAVDAAVTDSSRYDVFKLVDAAVGGDARRALRIQNGVRAEGTDAVVVVWALTRELRTLAGVAHAAQHGMDIGGAMRKARVWQNRQGIVGQCLRRLRLADVHNLLRLAVRADAAAKGQSGEDAWLLANDIVLGLAVDRARAA